MIRSVRKPKLAFVIDPEKLDKFEQMVQDSKRKTLKQKLDDFDKQVKEMMDRCK